MDPKLDVLRNVLLRMRSDVQDGYQGVGADGKFVSGHASVIGINLAAEELDELFELVGIQPDPIVPLGSCKNCTHSLEDGRDRGWQQPCVGCARPRNSLFKLRVGK